MLLHSLVYGTHHTEYGVLVLRVHYTESNYYSTEYSVVPAQICIPGTRTSMLESELVKKKEYWSTRHAVGVVIDAVC